MSVLADGRGPEQDWAAFGLAAFRALLSLLFAFADGNAASSRAHHACTWQALEMQAAFSAKCAAPVGSPPDGGPDASMASLRSLSD